MSASVKEDKQDWTSDIVWVGLYSILVSCSWLYGQTFRREATWVPTTRAARLRLQGRRRLSRDHHCGREFAGMSD